MKHIGFLVFLSGICFSCVTLDRVHNSEEWSYFMKTDPQVQVYYKEDIFVETNGRSSLLCPKGYFISSIIYSMTDASENYTTDSTDPDSDLYFIGDHTTILELRDKIEVYLDDVVIDADKIPLHKQEAQRPFYSRELKQEKENVQDQIDGRNRSKPGQTDIRGLRRPPPFPQAQNAGGLPGHNPGMQEPPDPKGKPWEDWELQPGPPQVDQPGSKSHLLPKEKMAKKYMQLKSEYAQYGAYEPSKRFGQCKTMIRCVGHQACIFYLGNAFCQNDPFPGYRKSMKVMVRCEQDEKYANIVEEEFNQLGFTLVQEQMMNIQGWKDEVQYISVNSREKGMETITNFPVSEDIFSGTQCSQHPKLEGYIGECDGIPAPNEVIAHKLWKILSRVPSEECRKNIIEMYCSYQYNNIGRCVPPHVLEQGNSLDPRLTDVTFASLPRNGKRPDLTQYKKIMEDSHRRLIPVRIGFLIMGHTSPESLIQLLHLIHRPQHFYVVHIDRSAPEIRKAVQGLVDSWFPGVQNIRVLPTERSFSTSWGSYEIVRAELEGMEELLRMGIWDYVINLSGADLPIRNINDLADHLAELRGYSLIRMNGEKPLNYTRDIGVKCAWHACHGHLYNVTYGRGELPTDLMSSSQWGVFHRDFVELVVSRDRPKWLLELQYFLQTSLIPDELYFGTIISHKESPFKNKFLKRGYTYMTNFVGEDADALCRHREETDICGRGPGDISEKDVPKVLLNAHTSFFARKFTYNTEDPVRGQIAGMTEADSYIKDLWRSFSPKLVSELGRLVINHMKEENNDASIELMDITSFRVVPKNEVSDLCCVEMRPNAGGALAIEYIYILELRVKVKTKMRMIKASLSTKAPTHHKCHPGGHIRLTYVTTRRDLASPELKPTFETLPMTYDPTRGDMFWIHLGVELKEADPVCKASVNEKNQVYAAFNETFMKILPVLVMEATIINPDGQIVCTIDAHIQPQLYEPFSNQVLFTRDLRCPELRETTEGEWTIRLQEKGVENAFLYENRILLLPEPVPPELADKYFTDIYAQETFMVNDAAYFEDIDPSKYYSNIVHKNIRSMQNAKVAEYREKMDRITRRPIIDIYCIVAGVLFILLVLCLSFTHYGRNIQRIKLSKWIGAGVILFVMVQFLLPRMI